MGLDAFCLSAYLVIRMAETGDVAVHARELLEASPDAALGRIQELEAERLSLARNRKRLARELKNELQKRKRLMAKARNLSTEDLLQVVVSRSARAKAKAKAKAVA